MVVNQGAIWLVVGDSGSGKTTFCDAIIAVARQRQRAVRGLICPARFEGGQKVGIDAVDLGSGERRQLGWQKAFAAEMQGFSPLLAIGEWLLDAHVIAWGNSVFRQILACDLLVVDELGPLEFEAGKGWQEAFRTLERGAYRLAVVTVRESLRTAAHRRWRIEREIALKTYPTFTQAVEEGQEEIEKVWGLEAD